MMDHQPASGAVSFDLFGTLVAVASPSNPAGLVATALESRGVRVPDDWSEAFTAAHIDAPAGAEIPLPAHVEAALRSRGVDVDPGAGGAERAIGRAVLDAFDRGVETREGAVGAVDAASDRGPVGLLSNCSVPGLVDRVLAGSALDRDRFDAVVTSVGCGWRKPDRRAFETIAAALGVPLADLVHVGDDPDADGGASRYGVRTVLVDDDPLRSIPSVSGDDHDADGGASRYGVRTVLVDDGPLRSIPSVSGEDACRP